MVNGATAGQLELLSRRSPISMARTLPPAESRLALNPDSMVREAQLQNPTSEPSKARNPRFLSIRRPPQVREWLGFSSGGLAAR